MIYKNNVQKVYFDFHKILQMYLQMYLLESRRNYIENYNVFPKIVLVELYTLSDHGAQTHRGRTIIL